MFNPISFIANSSTQFKIFAVLALFFVGLFLGAFSTYKVIGWKNDSEQLAIEEAKKEFLKQYREHEQAVSKKLEDKLSSLRANEREIIREIPKIITRDVYRNTCIDDDGLQIIERARTGRADPTKPSS